MTPPLQHFPRGIVAYLDSLSQPGSHPDELLSDFMDHLEMVEEWIENLSGYTMDEVEAVSFENISSLLDSVYACLDRCHQGRQAGPLIHYLQTMFAAMDKINRRREVAHQSMQPTVNDFLLCGIALLRGRSDWKALENRLQKLESHLDRLAFALRSLQARLQPAVVADLETAFSCAREAIQQLKSRPEGDLLRDGLALVSESCKVLDYLVDWKHRDETGFQQSHQRFFIPPVGAELEALLEELDITESDKWPFLLEHARSQLALQLRMEWRCLRQRLLFEPARREEIWQEVEDGLNELELSLDFNLDEDEFIDRLENCLEDLSDLFLRIRQQALPLDHLLGTPAGDVLERIFAALSGTFPRILLLELDTPPVVRVSLRDYLADGCWDHLFRAGFELVRAVPQPDPNGFSRLAELEAV